ncbi:MAG: cytochrome c [Bryobacteraceae bacterium]|nr:cytochrome c [Bryobacteraceae bacterium]
MKNKATPMPFYLVSLMLLLPIALGAQEAAAFFQQNCASCHTIGGGRLTGPDLKNVTQRKDREWLIRFMVNPKGMIDSGDPYAQQILEEARGVVMPAVPGLTPETAASLLDLIEEESKLPESAFKGLQITDRPFTQREIELGRQMFTGDRGLTSGSPACISCHTMKGLGGLGGGRLGPDLTRVYERLQGRQGLGAWLTAPATPTMGPLFRRYPLQQDEVLPLIAYFEHSAQQGGQDTSVALLNFFFLALGGTAVALISFDAIWKWRFRAVRAPLAQGGRPRGET